MIARMKQKQNKILLEILQEMEESKEQLLTALTEKQDLRKFLYVWPRVEIAVEFFPQFTPAIFEYVMERKKHFLLHQLTDIRDAAECFSAPQYKDELFKLVLENYKFDEFNLDLIEETLQTFHEPRYRDQLFNIIINKPNWLICWKFINSIIGVFPEHLDRIRDYVFKNAEFLLGIIPFIEYAIKAFPMHADILQKESIEAENKAKQMNPYGDHEIRHASCKGIIKNAQEEARKYLASNEIKKNDDQTPLQRKDDTREPQPLVGQRYRLNAQPNNAVTAEQPPTVPNQLVRLSSGSRN